MEKTKWLDDSGTDIRARTTASDRSDVIDKRAISPRSILSESYEGRVLPSQLSAVSRGWVPDGNSRAGPTPSIYPSTGALGEKKKLCTVSPRPN